MIQKGIAAVATAVVALLLMPSTAAWAEDGNYPPGGGVGGTEVGGVQSGGLQGGGLPHTGFDFTVLWIGLAVLLLGLTLVATTRRRAVTDYS